METPHDFYRRIAAETGDRLGAIRAIRERFGLDLLQAKEVMIQVEGMAESLDAYQAKLANDLEQVLRENSGRKNPDATLDGDGNSGSPKGDCV